MTRVGWIAVCLAAFLISGCDVLGSSKNTGPPPKTLSQAKFVRAADRACARAERATKNLKKSPNLAVVEKEFRNVFIPAQEHMVVVLRRLQPPAADAARFQDWLTTFDQLDLAIHNLLAAFDARQARRAKALGKHLDVLGNRFDRQAKKLGLPVCAED
jgi:hypothetical protein